ncbi:hypothetical protein, partial [Dialister succinatiphilus]|uniref:hypothetical protein n=1 Tax=Dialister succinatiphilus TaxID=487173 RepID=UPI003FEDA849
YLLFITNLLREVVKRRGLCNINVWRRKSGNSMEDSMSQSVMYVANIPAGMQLWQQGNKESLYTGS